MLFYPIDFFRKIRQLEGYQGLPLRERISNLFSSEFPQLGKQIGNVDAYNLATGAKDPLKILHYDTKSGSHALSLISPQEQLVGGAIHRLHGDNNRDLHYVFMANFSQNSPDEKYHQLSPLLLQLRYENALIQSGGLPPAKVTLDAGFGTVRLHYRNGFRASETITIPTEKKRWFNKKANFETWKPEEINRLLQPDKDWDPITNKEIFHGTIVPMQLNLEGLQKQLQKVKRNPILEQTKDYLHNL